MNGLEEFFNADIGMAAPNWPAMLLGLMVAFGAGQIIAWVCGIL